MNPELTKKSRFFAPVIPDDVVTDLLFRFIVGVPEWERSNMMRICCYVEQAHWFYTDWIVESETHPECKRVKFFIFIRIIFATCDFLRHQLPNVDMILTEFRRLKKATPTYGLVMLDNTLTKILLVQGYPKRDRWGFPKGKIYENELPIQCAIREALEETGYDASTKVIRNARPIQTSINGTTNCLYFAVGVPTDYDFHPQLKNEISEIHWFKLRELPKHKMDTETPLDANHFYTVLPFVNDIIRFVDGFLNHLAKQKPKFTVLKRTQPLSQSF